MAKLLFVALMYFFLADALTESTKARKKSLMNYFFDEEEPNLGSQRGKGGADCVDQEPYPACEGFREFCIKKNMLDIGSEDDYEYFTEVSCPKTCGTC